jgi:hypothetical protein
MRIPLASAIWPHDHNCRPKEFDKVPTGAGDGEKVVVVRDISEDLESGVMLEKKIHFHTNPTNVLEHVAELHVLRIGTKTVEAGKKVSLSPFSLRRNHIHVVVINH